MRVAVLADIHANLPALRAVLDDAVSLRCATVWCLGDVVGRGPYPDQVVTEIRALGVPTVQGNWDEAVGMNREQPGSIWASPEAEAQGIASLQWTIAHVSDENRSWLRQLPPTLRLEIGERSALLFHGSPLRQNEYLWSDRPSRMLTRIASDEADDLFCFGHTHETFQRVVGASQFVAAGSVGCGSESDPRAQYAVIDTTATDLDVRFRSVRYDRQPVERALEAAGLSVDLLRVGPVPHPLVDAGIGPMVEV